MSKVAQSPLVESFTATQAARLGGLSLDMVNYLSRYGIVVASGNHRRGRGCQRKYLYIDVLLLKIVSSLLERGVSVLRLRRAMAAILRRRDKGDILSARYLVTDGRAMYFRDGDVLEVLESGQLAFAFVMDLAGARKELDREIRHESRVA